MAQPVWVSPPPGLITTIPEGIFWSTPLVAVDPDGAPVYFEVIAGDLPPGIQVTETGVMSGVPKENIQGVPLSVSENTTSKFAIRAYTVNPTTGTLNRLADRTFELTVVGNYKPNFITPAGSIGQFFTGQQVSALQIQYTTPNAPGVEVVKLISGRLPPGLTVSPEGVISGFIGTSPDNPVLNGFSRDGQGYDQYPFDFTSRIPDQVYSFTLSVSNPIASDIRTFNMTVYGRSTLTADNTFITADNTFITADASPISPPTMITPVGSIGTTRNDNFYAFQFQGYDINNEAFTFALVGTPPPGLTLDPNSGWLYGYIPNTGLTDITFPFDIFIYNLVDPALFSGPYNYSLTITGPINTGIEWLNGPFLGYIDNGSVSTFSIQAFSPANIPLQFRLESGSDSELPQGLQLLPSGNIAGRVSFDTFCLDGGSTTFDALPRQGPATPTTFDLLFTFTVNAYSVDGLINTTRTFSIRVVRRYNEPYENLYIQAMPPANDRALVNSLIQNSDIFPPAQIYRFDDFNFGVAKNVVYYHAYGLTASTLDDYVSSLYLNHYWKQLTLGQIETAQALDDEGNVIYEVVYSKVVDDLMNQQGETVSKEVVLPYPVLNDDSTEVFTVFPNGLADMRDQVIDVVGQVSNVLPRWMLSKQKDGRVLGFTPAWVIAYTNPGQSAQIAYNIKTKFGDQLNRVDFEVDRYELDRLLTKNWDPEVVTFDITDISGDGMIVTIDFNTQLVAPAVPGQKIIVSGVIPVAYNRTYYVISCTTSQITAYGTTTTSYVSGGTVTLPAHWIPRPPTTTSFDINPHYQLPVPNDSSLVFNGGTGYAVGDQILVLGSVLGGEDGLNDAIITVNTVDEFGTIVSAFCQGTAKLLTQGAMFYNLAGTNITGTGVGATWDIEVTGGVATVFDGNSLQFIEPVDMYSTTQIYDKYLVFPYRTILG